MTSMVESSWPPKSPREALLSSPGGRRRYEEMQRRRETFGSPLKHSATTPNLRNKAAQLLRDGLDEAEDDEDEDEETLQLKLAAIQARLKIKQIQKNREKMGTPAGERHENKVLPRPASAAGFSSRIQNQASRNMPARETNDHFHSTGIQVPLSPTRRAPQVTDPVSPRRYLLGIDKGLKGTDVSLKRPPPSSRAVARPTSRLSARDGDSGNGLVSQSHSFEERRVKSFSERMAESRTADKARKERAERVQVNRSSAFQVDKAEMEAFKAAAAERPISPAKLQTRGGRTESFSRDDIIRSANDLKPSLKRSHTAPSGRNYDGDDTKEHRSYLHKRSQKSESESFSSQPEASRHRDESALERAPDSSKFEPFSTLHLSNRILPHSFLNRTLEGKRVLRIPDLLRTVKGPAFELPEDVDGDYVVFGIVASKSEPKQVKETKNVTAKESDPFDDGLNNTNRYMVITLTDLKWTIDLFLFDTAFPRYYRLTEGILIAILNPTILPPPKHKLDTNRFSLSISSSDDKVLEVGYAQDIGFCKSVRKDGKTCQSWVDGRKTEFCDFHVDLQVRRTQAQRMGVNGGTGMFGPGGRSGSRTGFYGGGKKSGQAKTGLKPEGARYDPQTQSFYYLGPSSKPKIGGSSFQHLPGQSAASLIDADYDDPFIAAGRMGRGAENKEERFRRRIVEQQREREITQKLTTRSGGVGADYLRARNNENIRPSSSSSRPGTATTTSTTARSRTDSTTSTHKRTNSHDPKFPPLNMGTPSNLGLTSFRKADGVRLSPKKRAYDGDKPHGSGVKKTRFITSKGIKEAGRDSLGGNNSSELLAQRTNHYDDDDDDELEII